MIRPPAPKAARAALVLLLALGACEAAGTLAGGGAQSDYLVARQALETGNYDRAIRGYARLTERADAATAARLHLEYAHALLRANRFDQAIAVSDTLVRAHDGAIRASALAVRGTARHEAARQNLSAGRRDAATLDLLRGAQADLAAYLATGAAIDTTGSMQARAQLVAADLAAAG